MGKIGRVIFWEDGPCEKCNIQKGDIRYAGCHIRERSDDHDDNCAACRPPGGKSKGWLSTCFGDVEFEFLEASKGKKYRLRVTQVLRRFATPETGATAAFDFLSRSEMDLYLLKAIGEEETLKCEWDIRGQKPCSDPSPEWHDLTGLDVGDIYEIENRYDPNEKPLISPSTAALVKLAQQHAKGRDGFNLNGFKNHVKSKHTVPGIIRKFAEENHVVTGANAHFPTDHPNGYPLETVRQPSLHSKSTTNTWGYSQGRRRLAAVAASCWETAINFLTLLADLILLGIGACCVIRIIELKRCYPPKNRDFPIPRYR